MRPAKLLFLLIIPILIFHQLQAYQNPSDYEITSLFQKKTALIDRITVNGMPHFDLIISLLEDIENDTIDEDIDLQELDEFLVLLAKFGFSGTPEKEEAFERENRALLDEKYDDDEECYEDALSFTFDDSDKIVLYGGIINSAIKTIKSIMKNAKKGIDYVKEKKKEFQIGSAVIVNETILSLEDDADIGTCAAKTTENLDGFWLF